MARTLLYDPGMVGLPSVLVRTPKARARKSRMRAGRGSPVAARPRTLGGVAAVVVVVVMM